MIRSDVKMRNGKVFSACRQVKGLFKVGILTVFLIVTLSACGTTPTDWGENVREILDSTEREATSSGEKEVYRKKEDVRNPDSSSSKGHGSSSPTN